MISLTGCQLLPEKRIETVTKYVQSPPIFLPEPSPPELSKEQVIIMTPEDAQYLLQACKDLREGNALPDEYIGLDEDTACYWTISGFSSQGWYNFQQNLILLKSYTDSLREQNKFYRQQLKDRYEVGKENE